MAAAFWRAGLVDEVLAYLAPALLGSGPAAVGTLGIDTIAGLARLVPTTYAGWATTCWSWPTQPSQPSQPRQRST